ncbi:MAG: methylated-DNA--[protein]-cysteine S-methyltransferase [Planctomycetaceae bacterium]|nr:methylated-DNA--[protein]-cysteine S-methyltransferase [Planctomycetaceae bacterium]
MGLQACVFPTSLGWLGLVGQDRCVWRLVIGHRRAQDAWASLRRYFDDEPLAESDWHPALKKKLTEFAAGKPVSFDKITVRTEQRTEFQKKVLIATRAIGFGETLSYGELAARVGSPRAARAVGTVMASNSVPIIIPCHRVIASGGRIGGFSAPQGVSLKQRLLDLEARSRRD